jgi:formyltetrahydrofolate deformylase
MTNNLNTFILTLSCADRPGIVADVSRYLAESGCNILSAQQFEDPESQRFFMRVVFAIVSGTNNFASLTIGFETLATKWGMSWDFRPQSEKRRVMLLVSKFDHCLVDLIYRLRIAELPMIISAIVCL